MRSLSQTQEAEWAARTRDVGFERRDWSVVRRQAGICVGLLATGLVVDLANGPRVVKLACRTGALISGAAMLVWMYDRRRLVSSRSM